MTEVMLKAGTELVPVADAARLIAYALCPISDDEHALFVELPKDKDGKVQLSAESKERALNARNARINVQNTHYHRIAGLIQSGVLPAQCKKSRVPLQGAVKENSAITKGDFEGYLKALNLGLREVANYMVVKPEAIGMTTKEILSLEWVFNGYTTGQLNKAMSNLNDAKWLQTACVQRGERKGGIAALWNPVGVAAALISKGYLKPHQANKLFQNGLPDYEREWEQYNEDRESFSN